jgi:hypothetical protein
MAAIASAIVGAVLFLGGLLCGISGLKSVLRILGPRNRLAGLLLGYLFTEEQMIDISSEYLAQYHFHKTEERVSFFYCPQNHNHHPIVTLYVTSDPEANHGFCEVWNDSKGRPRIAGQEIGEMVLEADFQTPVK